MFFRGSGIACLNSQKSCFTGINTLSKDTVLYTIKGHCSIHYQRDTVLYTIKGHCSIHYQGTLFYTLSRDTVLYTIKGHCSIHYQMVLFYTLSRDTVLYTIKGHCSIHYQGTLFYTLSRGTVLYTIKGHCSIHYQGTLFYTLSRDTVLYTIKGHCSARFLCHLLERGSTLKGNKLTLLRSKSFFLGQSLFSEGAWSTKKKIGGQKYLPGNKCQMKTLVVAIPLKEHTQRTHNVEITSIQVDSKS